MPRRSYPVAWLAFFAIYSAALVVAGLPFQLAWRNGIANLLPDALLGLILLQLPSHLAWEDKRKARFFGVQLILLMSFVAVSAAGWIALVMADSWFFTGRPPNDMTFRLAPFRVLNDVLIFCAINGVAYAYDHAARAARAEALRAQASLEAMRSQLNPHFILNAFHAIVGLVRRDPAIAEGALERLGDLLRYSLRVHRDAIDEVPLREEFAFVDSYLTLERLRLGDRLQVRVDMPPQTLECLVPTFSVQILVENAIRHAIAPRASGGSLEVRADRNEGHLHVQVKDDGSASTSEPGTGIGLRLLQERLAALYGNDASLTLHRGDTGTRAELEIPIRE